MPEALTACRIPLMDVEVREPIALRMPLVIDFGSTKHDRGGLPGRPSTSRARKGRLLQRDS